jgi:hypothetical protein
MWSMVGVQLVSGLGLVVMLLLARGALSALLTATNDSESLADVVPWIVAIP